MQLGLRSDADEDSWGKWQGDGQHEDEQYWLANGYSKEDIEEWKKKKREKRKQKKPETKTTRMQNGNEARWQNTTLQTNGLWSTRIPDRSIQAAQDSGSPKVAFSTLLVHVALLED